MTEGPGIHSAGAFAFPMEETLTRTTEDRFWSKIDKSGDCWTWTASSNADGYGRFCLNNKMEYAHRVAYEMEHGPVSRALDIDHTCYNKSCVKPAHLRAASRKQNTENREGAQSNSKSGVRGVTWHKASRRWMAQVKHNGQAIYVGTFDSLAEASQAARAKRLELFTHSSQDLAYA